MAVTLSRDELIELTGYRQRCRQLDWIRRHLRLSPPLRADGSPVLTRAQVEAALAGPVPAGAAPANGPNWSKIAA